MYESPQGRSTSGAAHTIAATIADPPTKRYRSAVRPGAGRIHAHGAAILDLAAASLGALHLGLEILQLGLLLEVVPVVKDVEDLLSVRAKGWG